MIQYIPNMAIPTEIIGSITELPILVAPFTKLLRVLRMKIKDILLRVAAGICYLNAGWAIFTGADKVLFLVYLQTALLFEIFAYLYRQNSGYLE